MGTHMRKLTVLVLWMTLPMLAVAQQGNISPLEGRWVVNSGQEDYYYEEVAFFRDMIITRNEIWWEGALFSINGETIIYDYDGYWEFQFKISGDTLTLTDEYGSITYRRVAVTKSPLEGMWKLSDLSNTDIDDDSFAFFFGDIFAVGEGDTFAGITVEYADGIIQPSPEYQPLVSRPGEEPFFFEYRRSGERIFLKFSDEDGEYELTKLY